MPTVRTTLREQVIRADPDWPRDSQITPDVEFNTPNGYRPGGETEGAFREYKDGKLLFRHNYKSRGPYG